MTEMTLAERVTALEARVLRHDDAIGLARDGLALLSEDARAARSELAEFRQEVIGRLDGVDGRLDGIDGRLDGIDGHLDGIDGHLDRIDGRLDRIDGRFDGQDALLRAIAAHVGVQVPPQ